MLNYLKTYFLNWVKAMRGSKGVGAGDPDPLKNHKKGVLSNTDPYSLENHKVAKPVFNVEPSSARQRNVI